MLRFKFKGCEKNEMAWHLSDKVTMMDGSEES